VSGAIIPALVAAGGGSVLLGGIYAHEHRRDEAMRASRVRLGLRFPAALEPLRAVAALDGLSGLPHSSEIVFEVAASETGTRHAFLFPDRDRSAAVSALSGAIPSLRLVDTEAPKDRSVTLALRLFVSTPIVLEEDHAVEASRTLLAGLAGLQSDEQVVVRWALRPGGPRRWEPKPDPSEREREAERAWRRKTTGAGFSVAGLVLVRAATRTRASQLVGHIESLVRSRRGPVGEIRITREGGNRTLRSLPRVTRTSGRLAGPELLPLLGLPIGSDGAPGVEVGGRELPVPRSVSREGRLLGGRGAASGAEQAVALSLSAASRHVAVFGGTGAGKSSLLGNMVLSGLAAGHGGILAEPKDLGPDLLDRVPARDAHRVIPIDLSQPGPAIGLDLFGSGDPYLRSDVILSVVRSVSEGWGPRIDQHLRMGLQTVAALERPALSDWLALYRDPVLRRRAVARLDDPFLVAEWRAFEESLSPAEQFQHTAPAISRITNLLSRPALRAVLSQREPKLNVAQLLAEGRWLFVSLNPGTIGEPATRLLGAIVLFLAWSAIEARVALPSGERRPLMLALDELSSLASLPIGLEAFFERARSMNCSVVAATQTAGRLPESLRGALLGNVGSLVTFKMGAEEAARMSRELPGLGATDIMALGRFEVAARVALSGDGAASATVTGRTEPLPPRSGQAEAIRLRAARDYGRDRAEIDRDIARQQDDAPPSDSRIGSSRRSA